MDKNEEKLAKQRAKEIQKKAKARAKLIQKREKTKIKLDKLMETMSNYSLQTDELRKDFLQSGGEIDEKEQKRLDSIDKRISKVVAKVGKARAKLNSIAVVSDENSERAALSKQLQDFNSYLENMLMAYSISNTQYPLT